MTTEATCREKNHGHQLAIDGVTRDYTLCFANEKEQRKMHRRFLSRKEGIFLKRVPKGGNQKIYRTMSNKGNAFAQESHF